MDPQTRIEWATVAVVFFVVAAIVLLAIFGSESVRLAIIPAIGVLGTVLAGLMEKMRKPAPPGSPKPPSIVPLLLITTGAMATGGTTSACGGDVVAQRAKNAVEEAAYYTELGDCRDRAIDAGRSFNAFERCAEDADARYGRKDGGK